MRMCATRLMFHSPWPSAWPDSPQSLAWPRALQASVHRQRRPSMVPGLLAVASAAAFVYRRQSKRISSQASSYSTADSIWLAAPPD